MNLIIAPAQLANGQRITAPTLNVPYACATPTFNSYTSSVSYTAPGFNRDNDFILEMSDMDGSFSNPFILATVSDQNFRSAWAFDFIDFSFPENIGSDNFRIRVRSTSPATVSAVSEPFSYYFYDGRQVILNNFRSAELCESNGVEVTVFPDTYDSYKWYKNAILIDGESNSTLNITEPGVYFVEVDLGQCNLNIVESISNSINVTQGAIREVAIDSQNEISICDGSNFTFSASGVNSTDNIQWFKDGEAVTASGDFPEFTTANTNAEGDYYFEASSPSTTCIYQSQLVSLIYETEISVDAITTTSFYLLPGQSADLSITTTASNPRIEWFKDNISISNSNTLSINVVDTGTYKAIIEDVGGCSTSITSEPFVVEKPDRFELKIAPSSDYVSCQSETTTLGLTKITAFAADGSTTILNPSTFTFFELQWFKNDDIINGGTIVSFEENASGNGFYKVQASYRGDIYESDSFPLELSDIDNRVTATSLAICDTSSITLDAIDVPGKEYRWFKNGEPIIGGNSASFTIFESGSYFCRISDDFCTIESETLVITEVDESAISILPSNNVTVTSNIPETITATGGDSYLWTDANDQVVSTVASLRTSIPGIYNVKITAGSCEYDLEVVVIEGVSTAIPNVITPNGDGINEKWVLPSNLQSREVEITILSSTGTTLLQTTNYQNNWPETTTNIENMDPIFYYIIKKDGQTLRKGAVTILR